MQVQSSLDSIGEDKILENDRPPPQDKTIQEKKILQGDLLVRKTVRWHEHTVVLDITKKTLSLMKRSGSSKTTSNLMDDDEMSIGAMSESHVQGETKSSKVKFALKKLSRRSKITVDDASVGSQNTRASHNKNGKLKRQPSRYSSHPEVTSSMKTVLVLTDEHDWKIIDCDNFDSVFIIEYKEGNDVKRLSVKCPGSGNEKFLWLKCAENVLRLSKEKIKAKGKTLQHKFQKIAPGSKDSRIRTNKSPLPEELNRTSMLGQARSQKSQMLVDLFKEDEPSSPLPPSTPTKEISARNLGEPKSPEVVREFKVQPKYAYPHRWMTHEELKHEMIRNSSNFRDFRSSGDRKEVGSIHVEVLNCKELPRLDRFTDKIDPVVCLVCGPFAFHTDILFKQTSPMWLRHSKRACIFPIYQAYARLFVGVFDDDGEKEKDDLAGRLNIDICRLRPNTIYDVTLPLRASTDVYTEKKRGLIRMRFHLEWKNERAAVMSYIPSTSLMKTSLSNEPLMVVDCNDEKAFRNVALTVNGKHMPGQFSTAYLNSTNREFKVYKLMGIYILITEIKSLVMWKNPVLSLLAFVGWMHSVYQNSMALMPPYVVAMLLGLLLRNYGSYEVQGGTWGYDPPTLGEVILACIFGGEGTQNISSLDTDLSKDDNMKARGRFVSGVHEFLNKIGFMQEVNKCDPKVAGIDNLYHVDHMEFPHSLSEIESYHKKINSLKVSMMDVANDHEEVDDGDGATGHDSDAESVEGTPSNLAVCKDRPKKPLPHQDVKVAVKRLKPLNEALYELLEKIHIATLRIFQRQIFVRQEEPEGELRRSSVDTNASGAMHAREEKILGLEKFSNPVEKLKAKFLTPILGILNIILLAYRSVFNIFMWKDPFMSFWICILFIVLIGILLIFPWRPFLFVVGMILCGPQNIFLFRHLEEKAKDKKESKNKKLKVSKSTKPFCEGQSISWCQKNGEEQEEFLSKANFKVVVPYSHLTLSRFYDWPPLLKDSRAKPIPPTFEGKM